MSLFKKVSLLSLLALMFFGIFFVNAQTNSVVPYIDSKILEEFNKTSEVKIIVEVRDTSGIVVTNQDSEEEQEIKDAQKIKIWGNKTDSVLSTLPKSEFKLIGIFPWRNGFYGYITKQGLDILMNNSDVKWIDVDRIAFAGGLSLVIINNTEEKEPELKVIKNENVSNNISIERKQKTQVTEPQKIEKQEVVKEAQSKSIFSRFIQFFKYLFRK